MKKLISLLAFALVPCAMLVATSCGDPDSDADEKPATQQPGTPGNNADNGAGDQPDTPGTPDTPGKATFALGADISWLSEMESNGVKFYDTSGHEQDCMALLKAMGCTAIRLRVWVNPTGGWNGKNDVVAKAKRVKAQGMDLMVDFHYSDTWADPGKQQTPAAWKGMSTTQMCEALANHTKDVLGALKAEGIDVRWVQVGNETTNGMLFPAADIVNGGAAAQAAYARFFNAGAKAAKEIYPDAKTIVHVDRGQKADVTCWSLDILKNNGGNWDITGISLYPATAWQADEAACAANVRQLIARYGKPVILTETGFARNHSQADKYLTQLRSDMQAIDQCLGIFYWEAEDYKGWNGGYGMGAFTDQGRPSTAIANFFAPSK